MPRTVLAAFFAAAVAAGCAGGGRERTVEDVAMGLRAEGVAFGSMEQMQTPGGTAGRALRFGGAVSLSGEGFMVHIYRCDDERTLNAMVAASAIGGLIEEEAAREEAAPAGDSAMAFRVYVREPFVVWVWEDPAGGKVGGAVGRVLGD